MKRLIHSNPRAQSGDASSILAVASKYDVYYYQNKPVEVVTKPRGRNTTVLYVRDIETGMCFLAKSYQVNCKPANR